MLLCETSALLCENDFFVQTISLRNNSGEQHSGALRRKKQPADGEKIAKKSMYFTVKIHGLYNLNA
jgi:hypothetical protein